MERRSFGTALRSLRQRHNRTLKDVADRLGLSVPYVSDLERDRRNPLPLERMAEIATLFDDADQALEELVEATIEGRSAIELPARDASTRRLLAMLAVRLLREDITGWEMRRLRDIIERAPAPASTGTFGIGLTAGAPV